MDLEEINRLVDRELESIEDVTLREILSRQRIVPVKRKYAPHKRHGEHYFGWEVIDCDEGRVFIAFAEGGEYGSEGSPWGLVGAGEVYGGSPNSWYKSLEDCARDSGFFEGF